MDKFCRFCVASRDQIQTCDVRGGNFVLRSPELYDEAVNVLKQNDLVSVDGIKQECPLNRLAGFHACKGFPPVHSVPCRAYFQEVFYIGRA